MTLAVAPDIFERARVLYELWGATAKVADMAADPLLSLTLPEYAESLRAKPDSKD